MPNIQLYFLGTPQFRQNGNGIKITNAKGVALLTYLAAKRLPQTREQATTLLWPDSLPQAARKNLRNVLWHIRKTLGEDVVRDESGNLSLGEGVWVDLHAFEDTRPSAPADRLESAAALYQAPLSEGLTVLEAPAFELWLTTERERLARHYLRLLEGLIAAHRTAENWPGVISSARQALACDNLQEPMHQALMEAHARLGERAEALRQYDTLAVILNRELGVGPLPETDNLQRAILNGHIQAQKGSVVRAVVSKPPARQKAPRSKLPFVGRQAEHAKLDDALQQAAAGQNQIVLLTGELGIGKSRLWKEWSQKLPSSFTVLETRCLEATQSLPFAPLTRLFSQSSCINRLIQSSTPMSPIWLSELSRLFPDIKDYRPEVPAPVELPPEEERGRLFEAFTQVLHALNNDLLVLFIDDVHWVDRATLDWLVYLVDRTRHEPLLLVGAYRPSDAPTRLTHLAANWSREGLTQQVPLKRLTLHETSQLITALIGDTALVEALHAKSAGNPYFLIELSRAAPGDTPPALADLVRDRLNRLSGTGQQVVQAAAILEAELEFSILRRTSGRGEEETLNALDELLDAAILVETENGYDFNHPLVASVVRSGLSTARRQFLHKRAAEALEAAHSANLPPAAGSIAGHYEQARHVEQAASYAKMAGDHASSLVAVAEAVTFYRRAYRLDPLPAYQLDLSRALLLLPGGKVEARQTLQTALTRFESQNDAAGIVNACLSLAFSYLPSGEGDKIVEWVERALPHLENTADPEAEARAYFLLGAGGFRVGRSMREAETYLIEARNVAAEHQLSDVAMMSWFEAGNLNLQRGDFAAAQEAFEQSLKFGTVEQNIYQQAICYNNLGYTNLLAGNLEQARHFIDKGLNFADTYSLLMPRQYLYSSRGEIALAAGNLDQAEQWFTNAVNAAETFDNVVHAANIKANLALVERAKGNVDEALALLTTAKQTVADTMHLHLQTQIDLWLAELHLERGELLAARESLAQAQTRLTGRERKALLDWANRVQERLASET